MDADIKRMGYEKSLNSGIVLTGGTALLEGLEEVAEEIFDLPVRRGDPGGIGGLMDRVSTPDFSTSVRADPLTDTIRDLNAASPRNARKASGPNSRIGSRNHRRTT